jgi:hypothetical protein
MNYEYPLRMTVTKNTAEITDQEKVPIPFSHEIREISLSQANCPRFGPKL